MTNTDDSARRLAHVLAAFWGACGVEGCTDCLPLFDEANEPIPDAEMCDRCKVHPGRRYTENEYLCRSCFDAPSESVLSDKEN